VAPGPVRSMPPTKLPSPHFSIGAWLSRRSRAVIEQFWKRTSRVHLSSIADVLAADREARRIAQEEVAPIPSASGKRAVNI